MALYLSPPEHRPPTFSIKQTIAFTFAHQQVIYNVSLAFYANAAAQAHLATAAKSLRDAEEVSIALIGEPGKHDIGCHGRFPLTVGLACVVARRGRRTSFHTLCQARQWSISKGGGWR
jgi:hypothetical protein